MKSFRLVFFPVAIIYGLILQIRHFMFDSGILKSEKFDFPVIGIGNLSLGGTGKTPFVEKLIRLLSDKYKVAVLSRGYGRKSRGYIKANQYSMYDDIGDEPMQYFRKFKNDVVVAVDADRRNGLKNLFEDKTKTDVVILDDSFQHRYVKPGLNILLTDFHNLYPNDYLFPFGNLRDIRSRAKAADIIIITKTNKILSPITRRNIENLIKPRSKQQLYFSYIKYGKFIPLFEESNYTIPEKINTILLFTGIANPYPLQEHLRFNCTELVSVDFPDHHDYSKKDLEIIKTKYEDLFTRKKIIVTTEKDAMRLINSPYISSLKNLPVFYLPIEVRLHKEDREKFDNQILEYVSKNKINS